MNPKFGLWKTKPFGGNKDEKSILEKMHELRKKVFRKLRRLFAVPGMRQKDPKSKKKGKKT